MASKKPFTGMSKEDTERYAKLMNQKYHTEGNELPWEVERDEREQDERKEELKRKKEAEKKDKKKERDELDEVQEEGKPIAPAGHCYELPKWGHRLKGSASIREKEIAEAMERLKDNKNVVVYGLPNAGKETFLLHLAQELGEHGIGARCVLAVPRMGLRDPITSMGNRIPGFMKGKLKESYEKHIGELAGMLGNGEKEYLNSILNALGEDDEALTKLDGILKRNEKTMVFLVHDFEKIPLAEYPKPGGGSMGAPKAPWGKAPWGCLWGNYANIRFVLAFSTKTAEAEDCDTTGVKGLLKLDSWEKLGLKPFTKGQARKLLELVEAFNNPPGGRSRRIWQFFEKGDKKLSKKGDEALRDELADFMWKESKGCPAIIWKLFTGLRFAALNGDSALKEVCPQGILETINKGNIEGVKSMLKARIAGNKMCEHLLKMYPRV